MRALGASLERAASAAPNGVRVIDGDGRAWTNAAIDQLRACIGNLVRGHCEPRSTVVVALPSGGSFWAACLGVTSAGCDALPISATAPPGMRDRIRRELAPALEIDEATLASALGGALAGALAGEQPEQGPTGGVILLSSGTTGRSRFVRRTAASIDAIAAGLVEAGLFREHDRVASFLPMHHAYGFEHGFIAPLLAGAAVWQGSTFTVLAAQTMLTEGATVLPTVPPALAALCEEPWPSGPLRHVIVAGTPLRMRTRERFQQAARLPLIDLYGATELGTIWLDRGDGGVPMPGVRVRIVEPQPRDRLTAVADGIEGEIAVESSTCFERFCGEAHDEERPIQGWFRTGDVGRRTESGRFVITGRIKLVFDVGGLKVNPHDIEAAIEEHPRVRAAIAAPIDVGDGLQRVGVTIELKSDHATHGVRGACGGCGGSEGDAYSGSNSSNSSSGSNGSNGRGDDDALGCRSTTPDTASLRAFLLPRLAPHALPRSIEIVDRLPRTASGKVLRSAAPPTPYASLALPTPQASLAQPTPSLPSPHSPSSVPSMMVPASPRPPTRRRPVGLERRDERERQTRSLFDQTADAYDRSSGAAFLGSGRWYRRRMLRCSGLGPGMSLLDVGGGTGLCSVIGLDLVGATGRVVTLDPSPRMLAVARRRGVRESIEAGAESIPLPDASFDLVSMGYMLRHIDDLRVAFAEVRRVLKPLGRVLIMEVTAPERALPRRLFRMMMRSVLPAVGVVTSGRPSTFPMMRYWGETIDDAIRPEQIVEALEVSGFIGVRHVLELGVFSSFRGTSPA